jgi:hypothetical protein
MGVTGDRDDTGIKPDWERHISHLSLIFGSYIFLKRHGNRNKEGRGRRSRRGAGDKRVEWRGEYDPSTAYVCMENVILFCIINIC